MKVPLAYNPEDPLARVPGETNKANRDLQRYYQQAQPRSLRRLAEENRHHRDAGEPSGTPRLKSLSTWSVNYSWQARVDAADELLRRQEAEARRLAAEEKARIWVERRDQLRETDWNQAVELRSLAQKILEEGPKFVKATKKTFPATDKSPAREVITLALDGHLAVKAMETASKMMRLAAELETDSLLVQELQPGETIEELHARRWQELRPSLEHPELSGEELEEPAPASIPIEDRPIEVGWKPPEYSSE